MRIVNEENGQILVLTAVSMALLLGFVGLAADVGQLFHVKRHLQTVADAAATAGSLYDSYGESAVTAAKAAAAANGVTDGQNGATVTINEPPVNGPNVGQTGFVEAIVTVPNRTFFMSAFGTPNVAVTARAVAGPVPGRACIYLMNNSGTDFSLQGTGTVEAPGGDTACGIYSNSTAGNSVSVNGTANYINTAYVGTRGGLAASGTSNTNPTPVTTDVPQMNPPSAMDVSGSLPSPSDYQDCVTAHGATQNIQGVKYTTLLQSDLPSGTILPDPVASSTYAGTTKLEGIKVCGNVMLQGTSASPLVLPAGLYVFTGQVGIGNYVTGQTNWVTSATGTTTDLGITLDINGDSGPTLENILSVNATTQVNLVAPTGTKTNQGCTAPGGACYSIILAAPPTNDETFNIQWGSSSASATSCQDLNANSAVGLNFYGIIDAPSVTVTLQDQGGYALVTGMVVGALDLSTGLLCVDNYAARNRYSPLSTISLVE